MKRDETSGAQLNSDSLLCRKFRPSGGKNEKTGASLKRDGINRRRYLPAGYFLFLFHFTFFYAFFHNIRNPIGRRAGHRSGGFNNSRRTIAMIEAPCPEPSAIARVKPSVALSSPSLQLLHESVCKEDAGPLKRALTSARSEPFEIFRRAKPEEGISKTWPVLRRHIPAVARVRA